MSVTQINRANCKVLRKDINEALEKILSKHGLIGSIGRITFDPGAELRTKLTVTQVAPGVKQTGTPQVGEVWMLGTKQYTITSVVGKEILATRPVRGLPRTYRVLAKHVPQMVRVK